MNIDIRFTDPLPINKDTKLYSRTGRNHSNLKVQRLESLPAWILIVPQHRECFIGLAINSRETLHAMFNARRR